jgi:hypothetical protein
MGALLALLEARGAAPFRAAELMLQMLLRQPKPG